MLDMPCKEWNRSLDERGYGRITVNGKAVPTHRLVYCLYNNVTLHSIADFLVRHKCDNPPCIEPTHLLLGTIQDNTRDMVERNRQAKGEDCGGSVFTEDQIRDIRSRYKWRQVTQAKLAREFGVAQGTIFRIVHGKQWKHLDYSPERAPRKPKPQRTPQVNPNPSHGSKNVLSKLTEQNVVLMRQLRAQKWKVTDLAKMFGISIGTVSQICNRNMWAHVP